MISAGAFEQITLKLNEAVTVSGSPTLILNDGGVATYDAQESTSTSLVFDYVVGSTDRTTNLAIAAVSESAATVTDVLGNDLSFSNAISGSGLGVSVGNIQSNAVTALGNQTYYAIGTTLAFNGADHDALVLSGARSEYTITANPDSTVTIADLSPNRDFTHVLSNIESLQFDDKIIYVEHSNGANIARLYSAALDRAPDFGGLAAWEDAFAQNVPTSVIAQGVYVSLAETPIGGLTSLADGFILSPEFQQKYGSLDNTQFVVQLYQNVLARDPDPGGLAAWLAALQGGETKAMVLVGFAESPENIAKTAADWLIAI
jgi:serralysin